MEKVSNSIKTNSQVHFFFFVNRTVPTYDLKPPVFCTSLRAQTIILFSFESQVINSSEIHLINMEQQQENTKEGVKAQTKIVSLKMSQNPDLSVWDKIPRKVTLDEVTIETSSQNIQHSTTLPPVLIELK